MPDATSLSATAPHDMVSRLALLIGFRDQHYRQLAVNALRLRRGDRVLEIGCGTGRNFAILKKALGPEGTIIGLDASATLLESARLRSLRHGWTNVHLVCGDAAEFEFPPALDAVLSTYTLVVLPGYDRLIAAACKAVRMGGHVVVLDQRLPTGAAARLVPALDRLSRPFRYSTVLAERRPWESLARYGTRSTLQTLYFGFVFLAAAQCGESGTR